ncbi:hypothetical protein OM427_19740 [Halomonas sp. 18H]|nr:hypothetical protein [Halomonas sp. 18H]MCW4151753.1 hypothetical protein [Halomonas sp. 18H]
MTYFAVIGGLVLSLSVLAGWTLWRCLRWLGGRLGRSRQQPRRSKGRSTRAHSRPKQEKLKFSQAGKAKSGKASASQATSQKATAKKAGAASKRDQDRSLREPWRLTHALAPLSATWSLALVAGLLYGGARLAEFGMAARPGSAPMAYHRLVEILGLGAAGLAVITLIGGLAWWRCYRAAKTRD